MLSKQESKFYLHVKYELNMEKRGKLWCEIMDDLNFILYHFLNFPIFPIMRNNHFYNKKKTI